jgi:hypothetical protein
MSVVAVRNAVVRRTVEYPWFVAPVQSRPAERARSLFLEPELRDQSDPVVPLLHALQNVWVNRDGSVAARGNLFVIS